MVAEYQKNGEFLSRLCGGEHYPPLNTTFSTFLSRLCGGELDYIYAFGALRFLSRLCGGELRTERL